MKIKLKKTIKKGKTRHEMLEANKRCNKEREE